MTKHRTFTLFISAILIASAFSLEDNTTKRKRRQAPSINVHAIPKTSFSCDERKIGEYYADPEANCQVYHVCIPGMHSRMSLISFVCPNGTIFSQATRACTPYERVDCSLTTLFYENVHGGANSRNANSRRVDAYDQNDVAEPAPAPRARNTPAPPPPPPQREAPSRPANRFRSGSSPFRGQQAPPPSTPAPARSTAAPVPPPRAQPPPRPAQPAFRPPIRPPQAGPVNNVLLARPTPRAAVSTSTTNYNYEYEYEYEYEDEEPATGGNTRSKRDVADIVDYNPNAEGNFPETSFTCEDKAAGGAYADADTDCTMFHVCVLLGKHKMLDYKVLCADGTAFDQEAGACRDRPLVRCPPAPAHRKTTPTKKPSLPAKKKYSKLPSAKD